MVPEDGEEESEEDEARTKEVDMVDGKAHDDGDMASDGEKVTVISTLTVCQ
jgi:hypothetical protein